MNCALPVLLYFVFSWAYAIRPYIFHNLVFVLLFGHDASCPNSKQWTDETPVLCFKGVSNYYMEVRMNNLYTAVTKKDGNWWIGWIIEIPGVNCQERTHEKLLESLKITLKES